MDIEEQLQRLESRYRSVLNAAVAARADYLALAAEPTARPPRVARAKSVWQKFEARKMVVAAQIEALEESAEAYA